MIASVWVPATTTHVYAVDNIMLSLSMIIHTGTPNKARPYSISDFICIFRLPLVRHSLATSSSYRHDFFTKNMTVSQEVQGFLLRRLLPSTVSIILATAGKLGAETEEVGEEEGQGQSDTGGTGTQNEGGAALLGLGLGGGLLLGLEARGLVGGGRLGGDAGHHVLGTLVGKGGGGGGNDSGGGSGGGGTSQREEGRATGGDSLVSSGVKGRGHGGRLGLGSKGAGAADGGNGEEGTDGLHCSLV